MYKQKKNKNIPNLIFTFNYCDIEIIYNDEIYDLEQFNNIKFLINHMSKEIIIDKSYVEFKENKHEKVFIPEDGWNKLCELVYDQKFSKKIKNKNSKNTIDQELQLIYKLLIKNYLYLVLDEFEYDINNIILLIKPNSYFIVKTEIDTIEAWKYYPGKWQTWK